MASTNFRVQNKRLNRQHHFAFCKQASFSKNQQKTLNDKSKTKIKQKTEKQINRNSKITRRREDKRSVDYTPATKAIGKILI
jgi:hypothetical protein